MIKIARAGGVAAAVFALVATVSFAGPSQATKIASSTVEASYLDHAGATIDGEGLAINEAGSAAAIAENVMKAAEAAVPRPRALPELVGAHQRTEVSTLEQDCLASAVYFEARGEKVEGQLAVAEVVLNRVASKKYPNTICEVVEQPWQFSFVNATGRIPEANRQSKAWKKSVAISTIALDKLAAEVSEDVLWYHADYVAPSWGKRLDREKKVGLHIFYS
ncbi:MAG TPA: cell wall hydrolase [Allosphingosinicella sp.]|nr:cell wall hydrolase [Allosphingosinicella sp.]